LETNSDSQTGSISPMDQQYVAKRASVLFGTAIAPTESVPQ